MVISTSSIVFDMVSNNHPFSECLFAVGWTICFVCASVIPFGLFHAYLENKIRACIYHKLSELFLKLVQLIGDGGILDDLGEKTVRWFFYLPTAKL